MTITRNPPLNQLLGPLRWMTACLILLLLATEEVLEHGQSVEFYSLKARSVSWSWRKSDELWTIRRVGVASENKTGHMLGILITLPCGHEGFVLRNFYAHLSEKLETLPTYLNFCECCLYMNLVLHFVSTDKESAFQVLRSFVQLHVF